MDRSYIDGCVYEGNELIHGTQIQSTRFIRRPDNTTNGRFQFMVQPAEIISDSIITLNEMLYIDTIQNTFSRGTVAIVSDRNISIVKKTIIDNVFIIASSRIEVQDCYLRNVILIAPEIIINSGTYDRIQCFASDSIHVDSAVALNYQSALILKPNELS